MNSNDLMNFALLGAGAYVLFRVDQKFFHTGETAEEKQERGQGYSEQMAGGGDTQIYYGNEYRDNEPNYYDDSKMTFRDVENDQMTSYNVDSTELAWWERFMISQGMYTIDDDKIKYGGQYAIMDYWKNKYDLFMQGFNDAKNKNNSEIDTSQRPSNYTQPTKADIRKGLAEAGVVTDPLMVQPETKAEIRKNTSSSSSSKNRTVSYGGTKQAASYNVETIEATAPQFFSDAFKEKMKEVGI
jgi:hypothetical protein